MLTAYRDASPHKKTRERERETESRDSECPVEWLGLVSPLVTNPGILVSLSLDYQSRRNRCCLRLLLCSCGEVLKMEPRDFKLKNITRERDLLLENLRSSQNDAFEELARISLANPDVDVDFVYPHPLNKTLLDVACCEGRVDFVEILLKLGADVNRINEDHNRGPIHFAAEAGHVDVLETLLRDRRSNPDLEAGQQTALHIAVRNQHPECVKVLLDNGATPNKANAKGLTPIHVAAVNSYRDIVQLIIKHSKWPPNIDDFRDFRKRTTRETLQEKMPDLELPSMAESKIDIENISSLDGNDEIQFLENLRKIGDTRLGDFDDLLKITAKRDFPEAAGELMRKGLTCDASRISEAAICAVELGHHRVVREILATESKLANELLIPACKELGVPNSTEHGHEDDRIKCLRVILEQPDLNVRCEDDKGNTPLHYAARAESSEAVSMLLRTGSYIGHRNVLGVPPLAHMSPSVLSSFFDDCLRGENERTDEYEIEFDYRCLIPHSVDISYRLSDDSQTPTFLNNQTSSEMDALAFISTNRALKPLLKHPLLSSFLYLKWHRIRHVLYANFIFYVLFYALINAYILSTSYNHNSSNNFTSDYKSMTVLTSFNDAHALRSLAAIVLILLTIRETLQMISSPFRYVSSFENLLELALILLGAWIVVSPNPQIGAIVILLSAWELVILIGQHPRMSTGIEMFKTVSINFIRFLFLYAFLILAFALAFFTLFRNSEGDENFPDPGHSLFKTIIMLTGEFDANDIPFVSYPILSHCIFVLFVFLIAIVLFNLLNGLAVSDTADILNKSELVGLISRTKLIYYTENVALGSGFVKLTGRFLNPLRFLAKRILLFPDYLPQGKLGVKPYKSNKIRLYGRSRKTRSCNNWSMDPWIVNRARDILKQRGNVTDNEKIIAEFHEIKRKLERIENIMDSMRLALENNNS